MILPAIGLLTAMGLTVPCQGDPILLYDFEQGVQFSPAGNTAAEHVTAGAKVGVGCQKVTFGAPKNQRFALVQAPNAPDLHQQVQAAPGINGLRFWFRGDGSRQRITFRVQIRNPENLKDIRGGYTYGLLSLRNRDWHLVEIPFSALSSPFGEGGMPREALREYVPQFQFAGPADQEATFWVDHFELAEVEESAGQPEPELDGRELEAEVLGEAASQPVQPVGEINQASEQGIRLNGTWQRRPCPVADVASGKWETMRVPSVLGRNRPDRAMWAARRFALPESFAGRRAILRFGAVMAYAEVWLNGAPVGKHGGAYTPFEFDVTDAARPGAGNTLVLYVVDLTYAIVGDAALHQISSTPLFRPDPPETDRMGIWQDVELLAKPPVRVRDVFAQPSVRRSRLEAAVEIANAGDTPVTVTPSCEARPVAGSAEAAWTAQGDAVTVQPGQVETVTVAADWPDAHRWSPEDPFLYYLTTTLTENGEVMDAHRVRFGFREFRIDGGQFMLNGSPIRLRGDSHIAAHSYAEEMWRADFMRTYWRCLKQTLGINAARVHACIGAPAVYEAADEEGVLLIDQSSIWSLGAGWYARGGQRFLDNTKREFAEWVRRDRNHPSVVIWDVENEMVRGRTEHWRWVEHLDGFAREHDPTRPIEHSGAGWCLGHAEIYHIHHNEHYTNLWEAWAQQRDKPMIAGEWWVGGRSGERRLIAGEEFESYEEWTDLQVPYWKERIDEQRSYGLSGIMPFVFTPWCFGPLHDGPPPELVWDDPTEAGVQPRRASNQVNPGWYADVPECRPAVHRATPLRNAMGPLFICVREKTRSVVAPGALERHLTVANDSEKRRSLTAAWRLLQGDTTLAEGRTEHDLAPGEIAYPLVRADLPPIDGPTELSLEVALLADGGQVCEDRQRLVAYPELRQGPARDRVGIFDPAGETTKALAAARITARAVEWPPPLAELDVLVLGAGSLEEMGDPGDELREFVAAGGRVLCMRQARPIDWTPVPFDWYSSVTTVQPAWQGFGLGEEWRGLNYTRYARVLQPNHPIFAGIQADIIRDWAAGDGRVADDVLRKPNFEPTAVHANLRPLAGGTRREHLSLAEVPYGRGSYLLCQLHVEANAATDPEARTLLRNMVDYLAEGDNGLGKRVVVVGEPLGRYLQEELGAQVEVVPAAGPVPAGADAAIVSGDVPRETVPTIEAATLLLMARGDLPPGFEGAVELADTKSDASFVSCKAPGDLFTGLNCFDFQRWDRPVTVGRLESRDESATVLLSAHRLPERLTGGGVGLRVQEMRPRGEAAVEKTIDGRRVILTNLNISEPDNTRASYVWSVILTNLGVRMAGAEEGHQERFRILRAEEMTIDGNLEEWLCDIEDRNVTRWKHAVPLPLPEVGGIGYLMWDQGNLYVAAQLSLPDGSGAVTFRAGEASVTLSVGPDGKVTAPRGVTAAARVGNDLAPNPDLRLVPKVAGTPVSIEARASLKLTVDAAISVMVEAGPARYPADADANQPTTWAVGATM